MATLEMRNYGALGGDGSQSAATDAATWNACVGAARSGDTVHVSWQAGRAIVKPPSGPGNRKSGVDFAFDEAIMLYPQQGTGETFQASGSSGIVFGIGNLNGQGSGGKLGYAGKWGIMLDRRINPAARGDSLISRFNNCSDLHYEHCWIRSMRETLGTGKTTDYAASSPCFAYNAPNGAASQPQNITLDHVSAVNCTYGYGLFQAAAGHNLFFYAVLGEGGSLLRFEQQAGNYMSVTDVTVDGAWAIGGNCALQCNPHPEHVGALGMQRCSVRNLTSENMSRTYLFDTAGGLNSQISLDGVAVLGGPGAQLPVNGTAFANTTDGRPSRGWLPGATEQLADTNTGTPVYEGNGYSVSNVVYSGSFPQGGTTPPNAADWTRVANVTTNPRWGAGFDGAPPPPPPTPLSGSSTTTPSGVLTKSKITVGTTTPKNIAGTAPSAGVATLTKQVGTIPAQPEWTAQPSSPDFGTSAYLAARASVVGSFTWTVDGQTIPGAPAALADQLSIPTPPGTHGVTLIFRDANGVAATPLTHTWQTLPPPVAPPPLPPAVEGLLACGYHTAYAQPRGGSLRIGVIPHTDLSYENAESETSTAQITIGQVSRFGEECCQLVSQLEEWQHEVEIRRNGPVAFIGPITKITSKGDSAVIIASDMSAWFAKRRVHRADQWLHEDLTVIARDMILDAFSSDRSPGVVPVIDSPSGITVDWTVPVGDVQLLSEALRQLVELGLVWTIHGRTCHLGMPVQEETRLLTAEAFADHPEVVTNGAADLNSVTVTGNNQGDTTIVIGNASDATHAGVYGVLESVLDEPDVEQTGDADALARRAVEQGTQPVRIIESGTLRVDAPILFTEINPLARVRLNIGGCRPVSGSYRVAKRKVNEGDEGDTVSISVEPDQALLPSGAQLGTAQITGVLS